MSTVLSTCVSENLIVHGDGKVAFGPWSVPRLVADSRFDSGNDGILLKNINLPGKLLIEGRTGWINETPVEHMARIIVTRRFRTWITSNPNAIQFRDRWSWGIDNEPSEPTTVGLFNGQTGSAGDLGTNSVAEPNPGKLWGMWGTTTSEEWVGPMGITQELKVWYRQYVWTPPPWSDNANKNSPEHRADAGWVRIQIIAHPQLGDLVIDRIAR